jgi:RimJ/RimL family protein N-acetyltransferase
MMDLIQRRRAIQHLLSDEPADAAASYYAFHHPEGKSSVLPYPAETERAEGFVTFSRTGLDLFRPLVTMRLPIADLETSAEVIYNAMQPETAVIIQAPADYLPLLQALFDVQTIEQFQLYTLNYSRFEPVISVLVTQTTGPNGLPRFVVRSQQDDRVIASAGINWQSPDYASLSVNTDAAHRRQGLGVSVLSAIVGFVLDNGRSPLYEVAATNTSSQSLARQAHFTNCGADKVLLQATLKPRFV